MPTSRKQPKTTPTEQPHPDVLETPPESDAGIGLAPEEPTTLSASLEPPLDTMTLGVEDERPGIGVQVS